jgi:hypothetical protein
MLTTTRRPRAFYAVPSQAVSEEWAYQIGRAVQLSATEVGFVLNIRRCHVQTVDTEVGNDLAIVDYPDNFDGARVMPLNRAAIAADPRTGSPSLMCRYPLSAGFVPLGARRADGTPHPHAGTGFGMSHIIGDGSYEPSLVRDGDGSLLFSVRGGQPGPDENSIQSWRSLNGGARWEKLIHLRDVRAGTPVTVNKGPGGELYLAGNPHRKADSLGRCIPHRPRQTRATTSRRCADRARQWRSGHSA